MKMDKIENLKLLAETISALTKALDIAQKGEDPQLVLVDALGKLQLHSQRKRLLRAMVYPAERPRGFSAEELEQAVDVIDGFLERLNSGNLADAYEAEEVLRTHYSPFRLLLQLQLDGAKKGAGN